MTDKNTDDALPQVSKEFQDLPPAKDADSKVKGGALSRDGETMGGGTTTTGDQTIPM